MTTLRDCASMGAERFTGTEDGKFAATICRKIRTCLLIDCVHIACYDPTQERALWVINSFKFDSPESTTRGLLFSVWITSFGWLHLRGQKNIMRLAVPSTNIHAHTYTHMGTDGQLRRPACASYNYCQRSSSRRFFQQWQLLQWTKSKERNKHAKQWFARQRTLAPWVGTKYDK